MPSNLSKAKYIFRGLIPKIRNEWDISKEEIEEKPTPKLEVPDYSSILSQIKNLKEIMEEETSKHVMSVLGELAENLYEMGLEEHAAEAKGYLHMFKKRHKAIEPLKSEFKEYLREYLIELEDDIKKLMK
jgi:superfamily I DNA/RNA helicase